MHWWICTGASKLSMQDKKGLTQMDSIHATQNRVVQTLPFLVLFKGFWVEAIWLRLNVEFAAKENYMYLRSRVFGYLHLATPYSRYWIFFLRGIKRPLTSASSSVQILTFERLVFAALWAEVLLVVFSGLTASLKRNFQTYTRTLGRKRMKTAICTFQVWVALGVKNGKNTNSKNDMNRMLKSFCRNNFILYLFLILLFIL